MLAKYKQILAKCYPKIMLTYKNSMLGLCKPDSFWADGNISQQFPPQKSQWSVAFSTQPTTEVRRDTGNDPMFSVVLLHTTCNNKALECFLATCGLRGQAGKTLIIIAKIAIWKWIGLERL